MFLLYNDPPTMASLGEAKRLLQTTNSDMDHLSSRIEQAEATLAQVLRDSQYQINKMRVERAELEEKAMLAKAYLSPMRRLPAELLRQIFVCCWEDHPCCAWVLAAVCTSWRRIALRVPIIWSKIRLVTTQTTSADTIRLWLERSGDSVPLDIEIFLRVTGLEEPRGRSRFEDSPPSSPVPWGFQPPPSSAAVSHYMLPPSPMSIPPMAPTPSPVIVHASSSGNMWTPPSTASNENRRLSQSSSRSVNAWGHIAIYYLVEQMHRWKRFIFRFDRQFTSVNALKSITGDAPLLEEFEVSSAEAGFYTEWNWLPSAPKSDNPALPKLHTLTLQYAPFKWSSPLLRANLRTLNLRALPSANLPVDRLMYILANNPLLEDVTLKLVSASPAVLPLSTVTLAHCKRFHIGGHHTLSNLVDFLSLPQLEDLSVDIDIREIDSVVLDLFNRSSKPSLEHLSLAYGEEKPSTPIFYGSSVIISWQALLSELAHLKTLRVGGAPLENIMTALDRPDEHSVHANAWLCPKLETLVLKNCISPTVESDGVGRIVQMVEARNPGKGASGPATVGGVVPVSLKHLELHNCTSLGEDVVDWLEARVEDLSWTDLDYGR